MAECSGLALFLVGAFAGASVFFVGYVARSIMQRCKYRRITRSRFKVGVSARYVTTPDGGCL